MAISSLDTFGGSEAPGAVKSQDLTIESLTPGSALMKLAEGCGVSEEAPLTTEVAAPLWKDFGAPAWQGSVPLMTGSPIGERPAGRPSPPPPTRGRNPRSRQLIPRASTSYGPANSQRASSHGVQQRAPARKRLVFVPRKIEGGKEWHPQSRRPLVEPSLDLHKTNRKSDQYQTIRRLAAARKKSLTKNLSLGSQFNGSRSLDLLLLFSGPFPDSIA
ncbi:LOW QUALITY PROTEIN: hypothetical protein Cgig2_026675 [Carnegiea gigantea]|uniref:Uncharacterized protein n=1 Tax=Carnegiea gigantea TaxID=171969 RepID=A0A9Q1Q9P1_9CARY|nr:LOW QUALITY PROTEIN: hypothetical protein Cgig2_026675 [Carnegiea gigantea]